jgi:protein TonB
MGDNYFPGEIDELPSELETAKPVYPEEARVAGISGTVWLQMLVGADGAVHDAYVLAGEQELRDNALDAVWQWRFKPAVVHGRAAPIWVRAPVNFTLR